MRVTKTLPPIAELIDIIQHRDGRDIHSGKPFEGQRPFCQTRISIQYRATDGRFVVVINGRVINGPNANDGSSFVPAGNAYGEHHNGDCEIHYFDSREAADALWCGRSDISGNELTAYPWPSQPVMGML